MLSQLQEFFRRFIPELETVILRNERCKPDRLNIVTPRQGADCSVRPHYFAMGSLDSNGLFLTQRGSPYSAWENWHVFSAPLNRFVAYFQDHAAFKFHQPLCIHGIPTILEADCFFDLTLGGKIFKSLSLGFPSRLLCVPRMEQEVFTVIPRSEEYHSLCYQYCFCHLPAEVMKTYIEKVL
jgi:hypothetical protein